MVKNLAMALIRPAIAATTKVPVIVPRYCTKAVFLFIAGIYLVMEELFKEKSKSGVPVPAKPFIGVEKRGQKDFYHQFKTPRDIIQTDEWKYVYQHYFHFTDDELDMPIGETKMDLERKGKDDNWRAEELCKCRNNFSYWCHRYVKILHPVLGTIPFIMYKYQQRVIGIYEKEKFTIVSKFRQGGLTTVAVLWGLWRCLFYKDQQIYLLSRTDSDAIASGEVAKRAIDNLPEWMYNEDKENNPAELTKHEKVFPDMQSKICFYTPIRARGKSATLIIVDEAAFIDDMEEQWKGMYPVIATGGAVAVISTVNGTGNWYEIMYHQAEAGQNEFKVIDLEYWEHPQYSSPTWADAARSNMSDKAWAQEYERDFQSSGDTFIPSRVISEIEFGVRDKTPIKRKFPQWCNKGKSIRAQEWEDEGALWIWKEPLEGREYIIGVDCAEGVGDEGDNSCFQVFDLISSEQVAEFYSNLVPPHYFAKMIHTIGNWYNVALVVAESNGLGAAVLGDLQYDLAYENLYYETKKTRNETPGIKIGEQNRKLILETLQNRILTGSVIFNSKRFVSELKTFRFNKQQRKAAAAKNSHDDAIIAVSLALHVRDAQIRDMPPGAEVQRDGITMLRQEDLEEIKREIIASEDERWLDDDNDVLLSSISDDEEAPAFLFRRRHDNILRSFGF